MIIAFTDYNRNFSSQYKFGGFYISLFMLLFIINSVFVTLRAVVLVVKDVKKNRKQKSRSVAVKGIDHFG